MLGLVSLLVLGVAVVVWRVRLRLPEPSPAVTPSATATPTPTATATETPTPMPTRTPTPQRLALESLLPLPRSLRDVTGLLSVRVGPRLREKFAAAAVRYPPRRVSLLGFKAERRLELWASAASDPLRLVHVYDVLGASGVAGPKLREGDWQVPEGIYTLVGLNPNSNFHLSLKINYPNDFDRRMARLDGRTRLGGDIFIHGGSVSIGCLAIGDWAAEELFLLAAEIDYRNVEVILAPRDLRREHRGGGAGDGEGPAWRFDLYGDIAAALAPYTTGDVGG